MSWRALLQHTKEGFWVRASSDRIKNTMKQAKYFILTAQDLQGCKQKYAIRHIDRIFVVDIVFGPPSPRFVLKRSKGKLHNF